MRIQFRVNQVGAEVDEAVVCGVAGPDASGAEHYLTFQRDLADSDEDWGAYLEYDDQSMGGYDCVRACRLSRDRLSVDLSQQIGDLEDVDGFDVLLEIDDASYVVLLEGLRLVFRGMPETLQEG